MRISRPPALAGLAAAYGPLFDRAAAMFAADDRVRGMWVHGSAGRGAADAGSDLDLVLAVRDGDAAPSQPSVLASREAAFAAFFRDAPPIAEGNRVPWSRRLEEAVRAYLETQSLPLPPPAPAMTRPLEPPWAPAGP